jgi:hypothetical protein
MEAKMELPQAFSVRDDHEFFPTQHLMARLNPKVVVKQVATGVHVKGGCTVFWGIVYLEDHPLTKPEVEGALRRAGFDFAHNLLTQITQIWNNEDGKGST